MGRGKKLVDQRMVVDKALELIESRGYGNFSTRSLAGELGISVMTLYNYFPSRDALLHEVVGTGTLRFKREIVDRIVVPEGRNARCLELYRILPEALAAWGLAHPLLYGFLFDVSFPGSPNGEEGHRLHARVHERVALHFEDPARGASFKRAAFLFQTVVHRMVLALIQGSFGLGADDFRALTREAFDRLLAPFAAELEEGPSFDEMLSHGLLLADQMETRPFVRARAANEGDGGAAGPVPRP